MKKVNNYFIGRDLLIATKHAKEKVIAPVLTSALQVKCFTLPNLDTDLFGTFTGEVERKDDPLTTARKKCLYAMEQANCDLAIASEGSFGPHPSLYFVPANEEWLILIDKKNNFEIVVRELSTQTNFSSKTISDRNDLIEFAGNIGFPGHGIILKHTLHNTLTVQKNFSSLHHLLVQYHQMMNKGGIVTAETDMRAVHNPTRMQVIEKAAQQLVKKIQSACPSCGAPGYGIVEAKEGLPCAWCSTPTHVTMSYVYACHQCHFQEEKLYPHGKPLAEPMYCDICNP